VHHLMVNDQDTIRAIAERFPDAMVNGMVSRAELSHYIARDARHIKTLESILHPRVRAAEIAAIEDARAKGKKTIVLDIPLLFESGAEALCDAVIAVSAPLETRKQRALTRPGMTDEKFARLIARQWTDEQREAKADYVIRTDGSEEETAQQVKTLLEELSLL
jgi:dephospho-CoA kinase